MVNKDEPVDEGSDALARRLARGEEAAFRDAYRRHGGDLYRAAARILGNAADAEDAVQEVFAALAAGQRPLAGVKDLGAYLFVSLRRAAWRIGQRRARDAAGRLIDPPAPAVAGEADEAQRLRKALARLPAEQREVLALKIDGGLTFAQAAAVLGISANTAASRYRYALEKLKEMMEPRP